MYGKPNTRPLLSAKVAIVGLIMFSLGYSLALFGVVHLIGWSPFKESSIRSIQERRTEASDDTAAVVELEELDSPLDSNKSDVISCQTSKGDIDITLDPVSAPNGVIELKRMVQNKFLTDMAFFRVNDDITQFGVREKVFKYKSNWKRDRHHESLKAKRKPWTRGVMAMIGGTQMVIVKKDSKVMGLNNHDTIVGRLDEKSMMVIDKLYAYNDIIDHPHRGAGPDQTDVYLKGWKYLEEIFPLIDRIITCEIVET